MECYPADRDVVNVANMRHLWLLHDLVLPFFWREAVTIEIPMWLLWISPALACGATVWWLAGRSRDYDFAGPFLAAGACVATLLFYVGLLLGRCSA